MIDAWSPRLRKAFLDSIYQIRNSAQLDQIARMLENGDVDGALQAVGLNPVQFRPLDKTIIDAFESGGINAAKAVPAVVASNGFKVVFRFNIRNPKAEAWLSDYSSSLVKQIVDDQRVMIRQNLTRALAAGTNPRTAALDLVGRIGASGNREGGVIGLTSSQDQWVQNYADELSSDSPTAALSRNLRDARFDSTVQDAADSGEPLTADQIDTMTTAYKNRALMYRAQTIARTEMQTSLHEAQQQSMQQAVDSGVIQANTVTMIWRTAEDDRVRDSHVFMDGQTVAMGQSFVSGDGNMLAYPGDFDAPPEETINCRCWVEPSVDFLSGVL